ncbi:MAG TPA: NAD(P)H-hydrate dehydratase [Candidatus Binataceae bacterium]|nr:NAD(P)H-hydrate dehydratase [Candidatus Binataceae bacterium]
MRLLNADESRRLDRLSHDKYAISFWSLMSNAGAGVAHALLERWPQARQARAGAIVVVAGRGNNGGDGLVAARVLHESGLQPRVLLLGRTQALAGDAARACQELTGAGSRIEEIGSEEDLRRSFGSPGWIIDAIFGTGLNAPITGLPAAAIALINGSDAGRVAVDIPSGINADTGGVMGVAVQAALTVTFGLAKYGHVSYPGASYTGQLKIIDIGFAPAALAEVAPQGCFLEVCDIAPLLAPRPADSHKGNYGHPLIIAGGWGKSGAALLAGRGALRIGAGLVTVATARTVAPIVAAGQAELMTVALADQDGHLAAGAIDSLRALLPAHNAIVIGPGIGVSADTKAILEFVVTQAAAPRRPVLIDADGLNALAQMGAGLLRQARGPVVLTPHPGEAARLLGSSPAQVNADRISAARRICELTGAWCLLKGNRTVLASPEGVIKINSTGNPGMASPGMGDALSGIIGGLLGQGFAPMDALAAGAFVHGAAADRVAAQMGPVGYIAGDLIAALPATWASLGERKDGA